MAWKPGLTKVFVVTHWYDSELTVVGVFASKKAADRNVSRLRQEIRGGDIAIHASLLEY